MRREPLWKNLLIVTGPEGLVLWIGDYVGIYMGQRRAMLTNVPTTTKIRKGLMKILKQKKYWLFDMDGTLTNAMHDFDAMRTQLGLPKGVPILEALAAMEPAAQAAKRQELDEMELQMAAQATSQPGSHELLQHLQACGAKLGIVTRNGREIADVTLSACGLDSYFTEQTIISRDCCTAKPDPAGVQLLLSRWNAKADCAVMVGDYLFDLEAGHNAGTMTIHMDVHGEFAWPQLTDLGVSSLQELHEHLL